MQTSTGSAVWSSGTTGNTGDRLSVQNDGNVVIHSSAGAAALRATGANGT